MQKISDEKYKFKSFPVKEMILTVSYLEPF